ncbi:MAG: SBBP repeat-containing protein, partial [Candidatus Hydrogenedentes bacterium]|nr:SBBP repeat-containing protein [Candidatus Hydrogenedentota bacterium]
MERAAFPFFFERGLGPDTHDGWIARSATFGACFSPAEMLIVPTGGASSQKGHSSSFRMRLIGAADDARVLEGTPLPAKANYLLGPEREWRTGIPVYGEASFQGVYPGIDIVYHGRGGRLEFDFIVWPGADPSQIVLAAGPDNRLQSDGRNGLRLHSTAESIRLDAPIAYQEEGPRRATTDCAYRTLEDGFGFEVGLYDRSRPLIIDPVVDVSTYVGMPSADARGIGVDGDGNIYVSGMTTSREFDFGGTHFDDQLDGESDMFVVKFNPDASEVLYATYIGGSGNDTAKCMFVDREGCVYLGGNT